MKKEYIVELREEEADELMNEHWVGELVRCKDCKHWEQQTGHCPYNSIFTHSEWFCADGEKDDGQMKRPKETFWDSLSETDLMEPMHHFED